MGGMFMSNASSVRLRTALVAPFLRHSPQPVSNVPLGRRLRPDRGSGRNAMSERSVAVRARNLRKVYGAGGAEVAALRDVDLDIEASRLTAIMAPSGSTGVSPVTALAVE